MSREAELQAKYAAPLRAAGFELLSVEPMTRGVELRVRASGGVLCRVADLGDPARAVVAMFRASEQLKSLEEPCDDD